MATAIFGRFDASRAELSHLVPPKLKALLETPLQNGQRFLGRVSSLSEKGEFRPSLAAMRVRT